MSIFVIFKLFITYNQGEDDTDIVEEKTARLYALVY